MSAITHQPHPARLGAKNRGAPAGRGTGFETGPDHNYLIKIVGSTILVVLGVAALALLGWAPGGFADAARDHLGGVLHATQRLLGEPSDQGRLNPNAAAVQLHRSEGSKRIGHTQGRLYADPAASPLAFGTTPDWPSA